MPEIKLTPKLFYEKEAQPDAPEVIFQHGELTSLELGHAKLLAQTQFYSLVQIAARMKVEKCTYREAFLTLRSEGVVT